MSKLGTLTLVWQPVKMENSDGKPAELRSKIDIVLYHVDDCDFGPIYTERYMVLLYTH